MRKLDLLIYTITICLLTSCGTGGYVTKGERYTKMYEKDPKIILIMPPINNTVNVEAKEFFYVTLYQSLNEAGYYVIPPLLALEIFKEESAYDSEIFINAPLHKFKEIFGADAVIFTTIHEWKKQALDAKINVEIAYLIRSTDNDDELFYRKGDISYQTYTKKEGSNSSGFLGFILDAALNATASALSTTSTNHTEVARMCNEYILSDLPAGPYSSKHSLDKTLSSGDREIKKLIKANN